MWFQRSDFLSYFSQSFFFWKFWFPKRMRMKLKQICSTWDWFLFQEEREKIIPCKSPRLHAVIRILKDQNGFLFFFHAEEGKEESLITSLLIVCVVLDPTTCQTLFITENDYSTPSRFLVSRRKGSTSLIDKVSKHWFKCAKLSADLLIIYIHSGWALVWDGSLWKLWTCWDNHLRQLNKNTN